VRYSIFIVLFAAALTCAVGLGRPAITDSDEAFYAEAGREMRESGDLLTPRFNYANRFQKPVLYYWGVTASYAVLGVTEAAARLPAALSGIALAWLAWLCGRRWFDEATGRVAGLVAATSLGPAAIARLALPDLPLALLISLAIVIGIEAALVPARPRPWLMTLAGAAAGAAFLMKGPVGIVLPGLVLAALVLIERRWSALAPGPIARAIVAAVLVGAPWYVAMARAHGSAYLESFFVGDNLERFATDRFNDPRPIWFYLPILLAGAFPWSPFIALWVLPAWRTVRDRLQPDPVHVRLLVWGALPLLLFTISVGKQPRYILPVLLPLAVAIGASLQRRIRADAGDPGRLFRTCGAIASVLIASLGMILTLLPPEPLGVTRVVLLAGGSLAIVMGLASAVVAIWRPRWLPDSLSVAAVVLMLAAQYGLLSAPGPDRVQDVAAAVRGALQPGTAWTTHEVFVRNLVFYVGQREDGPFDEAGLVQWLDADRPALVVLRERDLERIAPLVKVPLYRLGSWRYFNVAGIRAGMLLDRNPTRRVRTVVLVSNRPTGH
jgi:4-amino-4-deoxy-L-arabinose transferase-like glycosyltransferase